MNSTRFGKEQVQHILYNFGIQLTNQFIRKVAKYRTEYSEDFHFNKDDGLTSGVIAPTVDVLLPVPLLNNVAGSLLEKLYARIHRKLHRNKIRRILAIVDNYPAHDDVLEIRRRWLEIVVSAVVDVLRIFEYQITKLAENNDAFNFMKLSKDMVTRTMNYIDECGTGQGPITEKFLTRAFIEGKSTGHVQQRATLGLYHAGHTLQLPNGKMSSAYLLERVGIHVVGLGLDIDGYYESDDSQMYGFRLLAKYERTDVTHVLSQYSRVDSNSTLFVPQAYVVDNNVENELRVKMISAFTPSHPSATLSKHGTEPPFEYGVQLPVATFTGRKSEMEHLNSYCGLQQPIVVLISGMGGQGKTELCRYFLQSLVRDGECSAITWFSADTPSMLKASVTTLASSLNLLITNKDGEPVPLTTILSSVKDELKVESTRRWIAVFDNVESDFAELLQCVKQLLKLGAFIIVLSRRVDILPSDQTKHLPLQELSTEDAFALVNDSIDTAQAKEDVYMLCSTLQNYALALQQAIAYINQQQRLSLIGSAYNIQRYLTELERDEQELLQYELPMCGYDKTLLKVMDLALERLESADDCRRFSGDSMILLNMLSLTHSDGIALEVLLKFYSIVRKSGRNSVKTVESSLTVLKKFSIIKVDQCHISVHRVVQRIVRFKMKMASSSTEGNTAKSQFQQLLGSVFQYYRGNPHLIGETELPHIMEMWKYASVDSEIVKDCNTFPRVLFKRLTDLSSIADAMQEFARYNHTLLSDTFGQQHIESLKMEHNLAFAYYKAGDYPESYRRYQSLWERQKEYLGEEHQSTLTTAHQLATVLWRMERLQESLSMFQQVLAIEKRTLGKGHSSYITTWQNMANVLSAMGRTRLAMDIYRTVDWWNRCTFGDTHPKTLCTLHNMATCLHRMKRFSKALDEFQAVLQLWKAQCGDEHPNTLHTKYWVADTLYFLGRKKEAVSCMGEVLMGREKTLGVNHPKTEEARKKILQWKETDDAGHRGRMRQFFRLR